MLEIISRQEAAANREQAQLLGEPLYMGRPCKFLHDGQRYTKGGACVQCVRERALRRQYTARRMREDLDFKLRIYLRTRLNVAIKRGYRAGSAVRDLGCSIDEFRVYIETQFEPGMNWENWGEWELDHIKLLALFDLTERAQFLEACHYTNIRPLWKAENAARNGRSYAVEVT